ncbi:MAG TPA: hypothetical protein VF240_00120 [Pyrinomonadaceae bacterium]
MSKLRTKKRRRRGGRLLGALGLVAGAVGTTFLLRRRGERKAQGGLTTDDHAPRSTAADRWARPGMEATFRAELMPGRSRTERTFRVARLLPSGRVTLDGVAGEHAESEFEQIRK